jgi:GAF domain-containing protein
LTESALEQGLAELTRFFVGDRSVADTLRRVAELTVDAVPSAALVGLTMMVEGRPRTAVFTDLAAPHIDQAQYETGDGPCLEAFKTGTVKRIGSTLAEGPWAEFRRVAAGHGVRSTLSMPMKVAEGPIGAMNLYSRTEHAFDEDEQAMAARFADQAAIVLANADAYWTAQELGQNLREAMKFRGVIEQAKGMLMMAQGCDEEEAFQLLVRASQRENRKLRDMAQDIVQGNVERRRRERAQAQRGEDDGGPLPA